MPASEEAHVLGIDSGMVPFAEPDNVGRALEEAEGWLDGLDVLPEAGGVRTAHAFVADAGGDGVAEVDAVVADDRVVIFTLHLEGPDDAGDWRPLGELPVPSRQLFVGDPAPAEQFEPYAFEGAWVAAGVWCVLRLAADHLELQVQVVDGRAAAIRGRARAREEAPSSSG